MEVLLGDDLELSLDIHIMAEDFRPEYSGFQLFTCLVLQPHYHGPGI